MSASAIWERLAERIRTSVPYRELAAGAPAASGLPVPAAAWVTSLLARDLDRPLLVVVAHESEAIAWMRAARLFGASAEGFTAPALTPYQQPEPSLAVVAREAVVLDRLFRGEVRQLVTTVRALFRRLPTRETFARAVVEIAPGDQVDLGALAARAEALGYRRSDLVQEVGEYAVRGGIFDCHPPGLPAPARLDLFGDTVESLRAFDPVDQRSRGALESLRLLPLELFDSAPEELAEALAPFAAEAGHEGAAVIESLRAGERPPGWRSWLPLAANATASVAALAPPEVLGIAVEPAALDAELEAHLAALAADHRSRRERLALAPPPDRLEFPGVEVRRTLDALELRLPRLAGADAGVDFGASSSELLVDQLPRFPRQVESARARGDEVIVVAPEAHHGRLEELARTYDLALGAGGVVLVAGELDRGFRLPAAGAVLFGEGQLFRRLPMVRRQRDRIGPLIDSLRDLRIGDYVVHEDHGIGQFVGLRTVAESAAPAPELPPALAPARPDGGRGVGVEVMEIRYQDDQVLLLPATRLDRIQGYAGLAGAAPRLDRLGGTSWARTKARVRLDMRKMAGELLELYAARQLARAPAMPPDSDFQRQFELAFDYEPTADQLEAARAIKRDLERDIPADRLLCGDVGFGKTEVAMRAAFKVVDGGYQVAVLAPTTILADQHLDTFSRRFAGFPVRVEMVSRFRSATEIRAVLADLADGKVDIVIGTHRLLSRDVALPRLALLVVDEEQRFGVAQKERLKNLKQNVHVLAMTATPVPRTLQLSLAGVRDLSTIDSPPANRMAVETAIRPYTRGLVAEAIEYELERGGQVYYVFNRVAGIEARAGKLAEICPRARLVVCHGQMDEIELSRRMHAFTAGEHDVLVATTIIENGIDIPNVNTIIVHRADRFGLAQLYQLRGRVGRSSELAYCYLLVGDESSLSAVARERLAAMREFSELGAGFRLAARDMEIRGAGNLLGAEQSGHISAVGLETYLKMLEEAVRDLKGESVSVAPSVTLDLPIDMSIPKSYIADPNLRMETYRRIATAGADLAAELADRFGPPPAPVAKLLEAAELKRLAETLRVQSISGRGSKLDIRFRRDARIDPAALIAAVGERSGASFSPSGLLTVRRVPPDEMARVTRQLLEKVAAA